jgi:oxygen-dependent protoporphyrinogen oxidase
VLVIGGGISGLAAAYYLVRDGGGLEVRLLEAGSRFGGTLGSEAAGGFIFERGPNGFLDNVPETLELARELGLDGDLLSSSEVMKKRYLLKEGRLLPLPARPLELLRSPLLSLRGRLRVLAEPFQPRAAPGEEDSVASFGRRRLGAEATATFLDPLVTGIHAGDVERLSLPSAFPRLARLEKEHGSLFRALWRLRRERRREAKRGAPPADGGGGPSGPGGSLRSFRGGLEQLVTALREKLGDRLALDAPVEDLRREGGAFQATCRGGESVRADLAVVALPAPRAASLFASSRPGLAQALEAIPYAPVAVVCLGYRREQVAHSLDGFGFLAPRHQRCRTLGMIWTSSIFPEHAPPGTVSLRALVGGARDPAVVDASAEELVALVGRETAPLLGISGEPLAVRVFRYAQGIPQYNVGHARRLERIEAQRRALPGLFLTGNAYRGVGINDCVREARRLSAELLRALAIGGFGRGSETS